MANLKNSDKGTLVNQIFDDVSRVKVNHGDMESLSPIGFAVLPSLIEVIEQSLVNLIAYLIQMLVNRHSLVFPILAAPTISRIDVDLQSWIQSLSREDLVVEVLAVPPETGTHADGLIVDSWSGVSRVATDQSSQTAASYSIRACHSVGEPVIFNGRHQLQLNEIEVFIALASEFFSRIVRISVFVKPVICVPDAHNQYLSHLPFRNQRIHRVLDEPGSSKCRLGGVEQILTVVKNENFVFFEGVIEIGRRVIQTTLTAVPEYLRSNVGLVNDGVSLGFEAGIDINALCTSREDLVLTQHPSGVSKQQFDVNCYVFSAEHGRFPLIGGSLVHNDSLRPGEIAVVSADVDLLAAQIRTGVVSGEEGVDCIRGDFEGKGQLNQQNAHEQSNPHCRYIISRSSKLKYNSSGKREI